MKLHLKNQHETEALAQKIAQICKPGDVIALAGNLGVGKSVFARKFIRSLCDDAEEVPSPTFTLLQQYEYEEGEIYHFDFYRLESPEDALELGIEEAFYDGVCLLEWPSKIGPYLPWDCLKMTLTIDENHDEARWVSLMSQGTWLSRLEGMGYE